MAERAVNIWQPRPRDFSDSNISQLMGRLGTPRYDDLLELSLREPDVYWRAVLQHCEIVWERQPDGYLDESAGPEFPRWFPGGRLNWVDTVLAWSRRADTAEQEAVVGEWEDGRVTALSYAELDRAVRELAGGLRALGISRGDRVGLLMENGVEATLSLLALACLGAVVVPLFSGFGVDAVIARLSACAARALIASTGFVRRGNRVAIEPVVREAWTRLPELELVIWRQAPEATLATERERDWHAVAAIGREQPASPVSLTPQDPFMVVYTSGTTGKPKGTVHTHGGFPLKIAHDAAVHFDVRPGDRFCWPADMGWIAGPLVLCSALLRGASLICYNGAPDFPDWSRMGRLVERHRITHFGSAPTVIRGFASNESTALQADLGSIRLLFTAGEVIDPDHFSWFQRHFGRGTEPLINYTGGTEASGALLSSVVVRPIPPGGFNTVSPGVDVDVVDSTGRPVTDEVGELVMRRPFVGMTQSFWQDDARYLETYWRTIPGLWVHGDLALRTREGFFFMMGRSDDTIKLAGKRVGPAEVEEVVTELSDVAEAAAIGVEDPAKGQKLVVFLVPVAGAQPDADDLARSATGHLEKRLGRPFRPSAVYVVSQLPKTRSSKIMRRVIRNAFCGLPPGDLSALDNPAALDELRGLGAPTSSSDTPVEKLG